MTLLLLSTTGLQRREFELQYTHRRQSAEQNSSDAALAQRMAEANKINSDNNNSNNSHADSHAAGAASGAAAGGAAAAHAAPAPPARGGHPQQQQQQGHAAGYRNPFEILGPVLAGAAVSALTGGGARHQQQQQAAAQQRQQQQQAQQQQQHRPAATAAAAAPLPTEPRLRRLVEMGFDATKAQQALYETRGDEHAAVALLLSR
jgi:UBA/TS-N domain